jgi:hypothetical protein
MVIPAHGATAMTTFDLQCRALNLPAPVAGPGKGWSKGAEFVPRVVCEHCGGKFYAAPVYQRRGGGRFCSKKCYGQWKASRPKAMLACVVCGVAFYRPPSHVRGGACSVKCRTAGSLGLSGGLAQPGNGEKRREQRRPRRCDKCSKSFLPTYKLQKACSLKCRPSQQRVKRPMSVCACCLKMFVVPFGSTGKFCSKVCFWKSRAGAMSDVTNPYSHARGGRREDLGGKYFRSRWEANWARYLTWLQSLGEIRGWEFEPETFEFSRIKRGARFYTPDFRVTNKDGSIEFHEVKGWMDPKSQTKLKRMAKYHPSVKVIVVGKPEYSEVRRKVSALLPGWESEERGRNL